MPKFFTVLLLVLFSFSVFAQSSLVEYGTSNVSGKSVVESPMAPVQFILQGSNQVNGVFADASCALCGTGQQTVAENFTATISNATTGIQELVMYGGYYPENIPNTTDNFTILVHSDAAGSPGAVIWTETGLEAASRVTTGIVLFGVDEYMFTFDLSANPILLPSTGTYWVEIFNNSTQSGNFFWETGNLDGTHGVAGSGWFTTTPGTSWNLDPATDFSLTLNGDDALPVELVSFEAASNGTEVNLNWETATETNNKGFEIQKSVGSEFQTIGFVNGKGTTTESQSYSFTEKTVSSGTYTYRLKQIDFNGSFQYSNEVEVHVLSTVSEYALAQNYPNPFNPTTTINFSVPEAGNVTLSVYNTIGQEVATLVNGVVAAGQHEVTLNAQSLPSGAYFYKLQTGNSTMIKKMLLLK